MVSNSRSQFYFSAKSNKRPLFCVTYLDNEIWIVGYQQYGRTGHQ
ncbi:MAG TPA: hypothetical protein V6C84_00840 [Coleofasciculaceae cyanobacterium]